MNLESSATINSYFAIDRSIGRLIDGRTAQDWIFPARWPHRGIKSGLSQAARPGRSKEDGPSERVQLFCYIFSADIYLVFIRLRTENMALFFVLHLSCKKHRISALLILVLIQLRVSSYCFCPLPRMHKYDKSSVCMLVLLSHAASINTNYATCPTGQQMYLARLFEGIGPE